MIIWNGWGILVAVFILACGCAVEYAAEAHFQDPNYYQDHGWPKLIALLLAASLVQVANRWVYAPRGKGDVAAAATEAPEERAFHAFFFVSMRYWPTVLVVLGVVMLFV